MYSPLVKDKLKLLPMRAMVAFATRCARRVQPLFVPADDAPHAVRAVEAAIAVAEHFAAGHAIPEGVLRATAEAVADLDSQPAQAAGGAIVAAFHADATATNRFHHATAVEAAYTAALLADAVLQTISNPAEGDPFNRAAEADLTGLVQRTWDDLNMNRPTLGAPFDPSESGPLGPLWTGLAPAWYREGRRWLNATLNLDPATGLLAERAEASPPLPEWVEQGVALFRREYADLMRESAGQWVAYRGDRRIGIDPDPHILHDLCLREGLSETDYLLFAIDPAALAELDNPSLQPDPSFDS